MTTLAKLSVRNPARISVWGDSQIVGATGTSAATRLCSVLARKFTPTRGVTNNGIGGESPTEVSNRVLAIPEHQRQWVHVFWFGAAQDSTTGAGDGNDPQTYIDAVDAAMAHIPHGRKVMLTVTNAGAPNTSHLKDPEGSRYQARVQTTAHIIATYPDNYLDIHQILLDANDGSAGDLEDLAQEIVPRSLRNDGIHNTDAAQELIAEAIFQFIAAKGW
jgi:lysophospholipase L1-like esterase